MSSTKAIVLPPGAGPRIVVLGDHMTLKIHGRDTGGVFSQFEASCQPQVGPPLHIHHREEETFFVIEGEFEFVCGDLRTTGGPGTVVHLPRGVAHRFKNIGESTGRLLITLTPAGLEDFFMEVGALPSDQQADIPRIIALATRYGMEILAGP